MSNTAALSVRPNGKSRWYVARDPKCGKCDDPYYTPYLHRDGSYGPFGVIPNPWSIDAKGTRFDSCLGDVLTDGTCIDAAVRPGSSDLTIVARRRTAVRWTTAEQGTLPEFSIIPN